jgi:hypothetical protein
MSTLLDVLIHSDLLGNQNKDDKSEWGRLLVSSPAGWHIEMAQWIVKVWEVKAAEDLEEWDAVLQMIESQCRSSIKWKPITLDNIFSGTKHKPMQCLRTIEEEEETMEQAMAEVLEDQQLDDGAIEIGSDE